LVALGPGAWPEGELPMKLKIVSRLALCAVAVTTLVQAADYTKPNIKPGLWEVTVTPRMSGEMPIPDDQLAKMTAEQRAKVEAMVKGEASKPHVYKDCMTPEKIAKGFQMEQGPDELACKRNIISSTASELTLHDECNHTNRKSVSDVHFTFKSGTQIDGTMHIVTTASGKSMTVDSTVAGKFVTASCGAIKDAEPVN
jgi:hypothetical protein